MPQPRHIALIGQDRRVYTQELATNVRAPVAEELGVGHTFDWPTWSPDASRLAFVAARGDPRSSSHVGVYVTEQHGRAREVYYQEGASPFYLCWSPDGRNIALLAGQEGKLMLSVAAADGSGNASWQVEGQPNFFSWRPDGRELLLHVGGNSAANPDAYIGRIDVTTGQTKRLSLAPADFRTPSWSADAKRMLVATVTSSGQAIASMDENGEGEAISLFSGRAAFRWSPDGHYAAALLTPADVQAPGGGLYLLDTRFRKDRRLTPDEVLAFWWAPKGDRIAYLSVDPARRLLLLNVTDPLKGSSLRLASLAPSESFMLLLSFFDQYSLSSSFWSPDGRYFLYSGHTYLEQSNGHQHSDEESEVFVAAVDGSQPPRSLGPGSLAVFAPQGSAPDP